jgi:hypothetical protein
MYNSLWKPIVKRKFFYKLIFIERKKIRRLKIKKFYVFWIKNKKDGAININRWKSGHKIDIGLNE